jgi:hypothetical protein
VFYLFTCEFLWHRFLGDGEGLYLSSAIPRRDLSDSKKDGIGTEWPGFSSEQIRGIAVSNARPPCWSACGGPSTVT